MRKINNKKSLVLGDGNGNYVPNIIRGGNAIPLGNNFYYIKGRKHSAGGVDIGADPKTGLEVEGEEVMKVSPKEVRVYSSVPFLQGNSPAELVMGGANPDVVFKAQEEFKDRNRINDDGTKYKNGGLNKNGRVANVDGKQSDRYKNNDNDDINQHFVLRSLNRNNVGNNKTVTDILTKNGTAIRFEEAPYSKVDSLVANSIIGDKSLWNAHHLVKSVRAGLTSNPFKYIYNTVENVTNGIYEELLGNIIGKDKAIDVKFHGNINKKPLGGNLPTNQNDFLDTWNASRLATGRYNNQLGDGRLERQAESRNTAREFHSPIGFAMNYGKRAAIRTPSMSDTDYRKEIARNAQSMKLRLNTPETGQGVIGGVYHAPTHSTYVNQEEFTKDPTVRTHENAHASRAAEQEQVISDILGSSSSSDYLRRPTEVYSRLMQFRQANNLDPNTVYDKDSFRELRKTATDYNLINTFKEDEVIDLLNNVAMSNDPNQLNLNNINLNTVPVYVAKYGTKRKSKMGKVISINGNVRNGLIHTPSREAFAYGGERKPRFNGRYSKPGLHNLSLLASAIFLPKGTIDKEPDKPRRIGWVDAHNRLVGADISQKPLDAKQDNTSVAHVISEREKRTRKFAAGGRKKAKAGNLDNIQFGINLGSSVIDALMGNIFANQLHSYTPPTITAPVISNPGEIKLNEEDLKDIPEPILMAAAKLKTRYNANPQLAKIEDETRRTMRDIDRNTSNSRVGLARKQLAALRGQEAKNQVYAQKENIETELINKDKLNQQEVTARNLARYDQYNQALAAQMANRAHLRLAADTANIQNKLAVSTANANLKAQADQFNAGNRINSLIHKAGIDGAKAEARANIVSNLLGNVGSAFDIWNRNKRQARLDEETLKVLGLRAPNVNKLMLRALGINE